MTEPMSSKPSSLPPAELAALSAGGAPTAAPAAKMPAPKAENTLGSLIDTVEAIIIALILALTFRAFVLEAFVIPTGSMAPTLLGAHFKATCPECGYHFDVDANLGFQYVYDKNGARWGVAGVKRPDLVRNDNIPCDERATLCPNCGFNIDPTSLPQYIDTRPTAFDARNRSGNASFAWTNNGDRILVFKYLYSVFDPQRWDVIVFKEPREAQNNYIKRLIGRPGETIEIINGDIYVAPPDPTGGKTGPEYRTIARKPLFIQDKLWQLVYDNDYYPIDEGIPRSTGDSWHNPWKGAGPHANEWDIRGPVIQYPAATAGLLQFSVEDPYAFNILGYNRDVNDLPATDLLRVGDLRLECTWTPAEAAGQSLAMVLGAPRNQYKLTWSSAGIELVKYNISTRLWESIRSIPATDTPLPKAGTGYHVVLCNVDHSVQFLVNGKLLLVHAPPWTAADALRERKSRIGIARSS